MSKSTKPLFIVWNDSFVQNVPIVDEQHRGVLATLNSLHYFLQNGLPFEALRPTVDMLAKYVMFHLKTEEQILREQDYFAIDAYTQSSKEFGESLKKAYEEARNNNEPRLFLLFIQKWWQSHLALHKEITPHLTDFTGDYCKLDFHKPKQE
jgi:hemerythrin